MRYLRIVAITLLLIAGVPLTHAQQTDTPFVPQVGQEGKDVIWVPTPPELVETMLNLAKITPQDFVMDLGSGDGRNIIAAAKRGARGVGVVDHVSRKPVFRARPGEPGLGRPHGARPGRAGR